MILKKMNKKTLLSAIIILLIGFFGYSQEIKFSFNFKNDCINLQNIYKNTSNDKFTANGLKNIEDKQIEAPKENSSPYKLIKSMKEDSREVTIRFQERWLVISLLA
jgi:hypothetical protein